MIQLLRSHRSHGPGSPRRAVVCSFVKEGNHTPLFCHGGNPELGIYLGDDRPVYWLFPHGLDGYPVPATIEAMAQEYLPEIRRIRPHGPYFFLGCSMGGLVMLEMARQLIEQGEVVAMLAMIDTALPECSASTSGAPLDAVTSLRHGLTRSVPKSHSRLSWEFSTQVRSAARLAKRKACDGMIRVGYRLPPFARHFYFFAKCEQVIARYVPRQYKGPLVVFRRPQAGSDTQWRWLGAGPLELHDTWLEANEFLELPHVHILAEEIKNYMQAAERRSAIASPQLQAYLNPAADII